MDTLKKALSTAERPGPGSRAAALERHGTPASACQELCGLCSFRESLCRLLCGVFSHEDFIVLWQGGYCTLHELHGCLAVFMGTHE